MSGVKNLKEGDYKLQAENQGIPLADLAKKNNGSEGIKDDESSDSSDSHFTAHEKSPKFNFFLLILIASGNYFFGYYLAIANVMATPVLKGIYALPEDEFKSRTSMFGFLFSIGCLIGLSFEGQFIHVIGKLKLIYIVEILHILIAWLYLFNGLSLLTINRFITGLVGGLSMGLIPVVNRDLFPSYKAGVGCIFSFISMVLFVLLASLQNVFWGGKVGLQNNWRWVFFWPSIFGIIRLALLTKYTLNYETPGHYLDHIEDNDKELIRKLDISHSVIYDKHDAHHLSKVKIHMKNEAIKRHEPGKGIKDMFSQTYRKRFFLGCFLNVFRQLGGINIMLFFSTQIFDEISGNGATMTLLIGTANLIGAFISILTGKHRRLLVFSISLVFHAIGILGVAFGVWIKSGTVAGIMVMVYMVSFAFGNGSMIFVYVAEILPAAGVGVATASQWIASAVIGLGAQPLKDKIGIPGLFCLCGVMILVDAAVLNWLGQETLGKTQREIDAAFLGIRYEPIHQSSLEQVKKLPEKPEGAEQQKKN